MENVVVKVKISRRRTRHQSVKLMKTMDFRAKKLAEVDNDSNRQVRVRDLPSAFEDHVENVCLRAGPGQ